MVTGVPLILDHKLLLLVLNICSKVYGYNLLEYRLNYATIITLSLLQMELTIIKVFQTCQLCIRFNYTTNNFLQDNTVYIDSEKS